MAFWEPPNDPWDFSSVKQPLDPNVPIWQRPAVFNPQPDANVQPWDGKPYADPTAFLQGTMFDTGEFWSFTTDPYSVPEKDLYGDAARSPYTGFFDSMHALTVGAKATQKAIANGTGVSAQALSDKQKFTKKLPFSMAHLAIAGAVLAGGYLLLKRKGRGGRRRVRRR